MLVDYVCAHALKTLDVKVQTAASNVVSARHRNISLSAARDQRSENTDRCPHPPDEVVVGAVVRALGDVDLHDSPGNITIHGAPEPPE
jgi:hypothetical protein